MLTIGGPRPRLCSGPGRRAFLRAGALGAVGLGLPQLLQARAAADGPAKARNAILLFLTGGPPQHETFDPKPAAPAEVRGEFASIPTAVPGVRFGEHFPRLAARAGTFAVVRSLTHADRVHTSALYTAFTGLPHPDANRPDAGPKPAPTDHPHVGSVVAAARDGAAVPPFVALPEVIREAGIHPVPGLGPGFLPARYAPFQLLADPAKAGLATPDVVLPADVPADRLTDRERLLGQLDQGLRQADPAVGRMGVWYQKGFEVVRSGGFRDALDLGRESPKTRDAYGRTLFGQGCLMARRLAEAGVGLTTVYWHYEGPDDSPVWDTHENNFKHLKERLMPPTDRAVSALLDDLADRGLLDETLVVVMGEFGRSPRVNPKAGRDHWPGAQSILMAGGGVKGGVVYGSTDKDGGYPAEHPVSPADVTATILHQLGVPADFELTDRTGRPIRACTGTPIAGVLG